jgi:DNA ligase-1
MTVLYTEKLYINHSSGQAGSWEIEVTDAGADGARIVTTACKVIGGKPVEHIEFVKVGKNVGRANETTPLQQAISEAQSKAQKKMDKGYTREIPEAGQKAVNSLGLTKPMLAQEFTGVSKWPVFIQPKLDGNRCLAARVDGKVKLWSRGGKEINLPHIIEILEAKLPEGLTLDGELYLHGIALQTITSWIKKLQPESANIQYHIYDVVSPQCYSERAEVFNNLFGGQCGLVRVVETYASQNEEAMNNQHSSFVAAGYEGTMVRMPGVGYEDGKRSKSLQKLKDFQDGEFEIVGIERGVPRIVNGGQLEVPLYVCKAPNGKTFNVTAPGDMYQKHAAWVNSENALGKQLTVKFFNWTPDGLPFLPVALRLRDDL